MTTPFIDEQATARPETLGGALIALRNHVTRFLVRLSFTTSVALLVLIAVAVAELGNYAWRHLMFGDRPPHSYPVAVVVTVTVSVPFMMLCIWTLRQLIANNQAPKAARQFGVNAYVAKPYSPQQLEQKLVALAEAL